MPAKAAIYIPQEKIDLGTLFPGTKSDKDLLSAASYFDVPLNGEIVRFNIMPRKDIARHMLGFLNYIASLPDEASRKQDASFAVRHTQIILGLVASSDFTDNHAIWQSLFQIADAFDGYVFVHDSILLPNGAVMVGRLRNE
jgi:hypothetical protein